MFGKTTYVIAVSGGVDSVVLLDMIAHRKSDDTIYVVAHFDHGIRSRSSEDAKFVAQLAEKYGFVCVIGEGKLGQAASEALARERRYAFLRKIAQEYKAEKIITAHHQDDYIETIILHLLRGAGIRALRPMQGQEDILRPLIHKTKKDLLAYAREHNLQWREDETNEDTSYLRNYVRLVLMPRMHTATNSLLELSASMEGSLHEIDSRIALLLPKTNSYPRARFVLLPYSVQKEVMRAWLDKNTIPYDRKKIEQACIAAKTLPIGKKISLTSGVWLVSAPQNILLTS